MVVKKKKFADMFEELVIAKILLTGSYCGLEAQKHCNTVQAMADEFDDLDDYLDEFDEEILSQEPGATVIDKKGGAESNLKLSNNDKAPAEEKESADIKEFAAAAGLDPQFSKQLEDFMSMLDPQGTGNELNSLLNEPDIGEKGKTTVNGKENGFQDTVNETINRLKTSSQQVEDESTQKMDKNEELLTTLLNSMDIGGDESLEGFDELKDLLSENNGGAMGAGDGDVDKLTNVIMKMLNRLTSKEMMYDSVNTAVTNYHEYFKDLKNSSKPSEDNEDYKRYVMQLKHLENVKNKFDDSSYNEEDPETRDYIDQEMENFNKILPPPPGVIQDNLADMGLDNVKWSDKEIPTDLEGCVQQ